jgi:5'-phosphate synthase pdxT subunit
MAVRVGLCMLQGARHAHIRSLQQASKHSGIKISIHELRTLSQFQKQQCDAYILPGGESTTLRRTGGDIELGGSGLLSALFSHLRESNSPVLGTCAGAILLCDPDDGGDSLLPAAIDRNAYGRQKSSFQDLVKVNLFDNEFPGVFIRAPRFVQSSIHCDKVATHGDEVVGILHKSRLALTFHPELTDDPRFHVWLLQQASNSSQ